MAVIATHPRATDRNLAAVEADLAFGSAPALPHSVAAPAMRFAGELLGVLAQHLLDSFNPGSQTKALKRAVHILPSRRKAGHERERWGHGSAGHGVALLCGFGTPSLTAQGGQRLHPYFNNGRDIPRPVGENNNDHPSHLKHDIRELKLNVVVFSTREVTKLDGAINAGRTTIKVEGLADARDAGFIKIENEIIRYTATSVNSKTFRHCVRGAEGTVAAAHADKTQVAYSTTTPIETRKGVQVDLDTVDERLAQAGIRVKKPVPINLGGQGEPGVLLPPALLNRFYVVAGQFPSEYERAVVALKDADVNTIDIFYVYAVYDPNIGGTGIGGKAYPAHDNNTGDNSLQNFVVLSRTPVRGPLTLAHEIMHVLLNRSHRAHEPSTALFHTGTGDKGVDSTKRIGPYPRSTASGVGDRDTQIIRTNAETLPQ